MLQLRFACFNQHFPDDHVVYILCNMMQENLRMV
jgi:hypothetical protein